MRQKVQIHLELGRVVLVIERFIAEVVQPIEAECLRDVLELLRIVEQLTDLDTRLHVVVVDRLVDDEHDYGIEVDHARIVRYIGLVVGALSDQIAQVNALVDARGAPGGQADVDDKDEDAYGLADFFGDQKCEYAGPEGAEGA